MSTDIEPVEVEAEYTYDAAGRLAGARADDKAVAYRYGPSGNLAGVSVAVVEPAAAPAPAPTAATFCMSCGTPAAAGDAFCLKCGAAID